MPNELAINAAFPPKRSDSVAYYNKIFDLMTRDDVRILRLWFSDFSFNYYKVASSQHAVGLKSLEKIIAAARKRNLLVVPVLFDFNELSETDVHWAEYDHTFQNSFLSTLFADPMAFFHPSRLDVGLSKFKMVREMLGDSVYAWELFNEVDQVKDFSLRPVADWARQFAVEIGKTSKLDVYISFSNPAHVNAFSNIAPQVKIGLHTYGWPYGEIYKNVIHWQSRFPDRWIMEFGSADASTDSLLTAMVASNLLNASGRVAMPWYWDHVLPLGVFSQFRQIERFLDKHCNTKRGFEFAGTLAGSLSIPNHGSIMRTLKLCGIRGLLDKGFALLDAWRSNVAKLPGLVFQSAEYRVALLIAGEANPLPNHADATKWPSIRIGGVEVIVFDVE